MQCEAPTCRRPLGAAAWWLWGPEGARVGFCRPRCALAWLLELAIRRFAADLAEASARRGSVPAGSKPRPSDRLALLGAAARREQADRRARRAAELRRLGLTRREIGRRIALEEGRVDVGGVVPFPARSVSRWLRRAGSGAGAVETCPDVSPPTLDLSSGAPNGRSVPSAP